MKEPWKVAFACRNDVLNDENQTHIALSGSLILQAKDIFEALQEATLKMKEFGYSENTIFGAKKLINETKEEKDVNN